HELNNPSSAARRAASHLRTAVLGQQSFTCRLGIAALTPEQREALKRLREELSGSGGVEERKSGRAEERRSQTGASTPPLLHSSTPPLLHSLEELDPVARSDRETALARRLEALGLDDAWQLAPALAGA